MGKFSNPKSSLGSSNLSITKAETIEIKKEIKAPNIDSNSQLTATKRRSARLCKSAARNSTPEKLVSIRVRGRSSLSQNKASQPSRRVSSKKKSVKSGPKKSIKVSEDESSSGSESQVDTDDDEDWKPDPDSQYNNESESEVNSLDDFRSVSSNEVKLSRVIKDDTHSSLPSKLKNSTNQMKKPRKSNQKATKPTNAVAESNSVMGSDSDDSSEWEDVNDKIIPEEDYLKGLLDPTGKSEFRNSIGQSKPTLSLEVPLIPNSKKVTKKDPKVLEQMALKRRLRERHYTMHLTHMMCFLAYTRRLNNLCDSPLYRALGLSLLNRAGILLNNKAEFVDKSKWTKEHLEVCIISILVKQDPAALNRPDVAQPVKSTLLARVRENQATQTDCTILLVAALRALAFDVRIVIGINPYPLRPNSSFVINAATKSNEPHKSKLIPAKVNRQIISSSEADSDLESEKLKSCKKPKAQNSKQLEIFSFAEVFLPSENQWIPIDPSTPNGCVGKIGSNKSWLYCIGLTSTSPVNHDSVPYVGRNPVDLAARYDPNWCIGSRPDRLPADKWSNLLNIQRSFFDRDALSNGTIVNRSENPVTYQRDLQDERTIREELLSKPIPENLSDLKNHPLYVLPRHLLKYQIIYPSDAIPLGFFKNEPVYSRDCVKLCHNRESWLKEAMVVKPYEKPVKVVKARPSMKRKLLQGFDDKPQTVELYGPWQVEPYQPPTAENGIVPRGPHGTVDLFKPCMLPIGCTHVCLTGIQHIAKKLGIDCVPAVVGWTFHGAGWAHPKQEGYIVCKESVPALIDAWRQVRMNAAKAAAADRTERALDNWRRLVRGLFLWHRVKAQFALAPLHQNTLDDSKSNQKSKKSTRKADTVEKMVDAMDPSKSESLHKAIPTVDSCLDHATSEGWQRLSELNEFHTAQIPIPVLAPVKKRSLRARKKPTKTKRRRKKVSSSSEEDLPSSCEDSGSDFV